MVFDLGGDCEGEDTIRISEDACSNVGKGGSYQGCLRVLRGGRTRRVESPLRRRKRSRCLRYRDEVAGSRDLGGREGALNLLALRGIFGGGLGVRGLGLGAVRGEVACNERGGVGVLLFAECVGFPRIRELVRIGARIQVKGARVGVVPGNVGIERGRGALGRGGSADLRSGLC